MNSNMLYKKYSVEKGSYIFDRNKKIESIDILLKGAADVVLYPFTNTEYNDAFYLTNGFKLFSINQNIFIGAADYFANKATNVSYLASEDTSLLSYSLADSLLFTEFIHTQSDYYSHIYNSIINSMESSYFVAEKLFHILSELKTVSNNLKYYFALIKEKYNLVYTPLCHELKDYCEQFQIARANENMPTDFSYEVLKLNVNPSSNPEILDANTTENYNYHLCFKDMPIDEKASFLGFNDIIAKHHYTDSADIYSKIIDKTNYMLQECIHFFTLIYKNGKNCIFSDIYSLLIESRLYHQEAQQLNMLFDTIVKYITDTSKFFKINFSNRLDFDIEQILDKVTHIAITSAKKHDNEQSASAAPEELKNSLEKIIRFSNLSSSSSDLLRKCIAEFKSLPDKLSSDSSARELSDKMTGVFFELYELVFIKALKENTSSRLIDMFLQYGYLDEELLTEDQLQLLYTHEDLSSDNGICRVWNMKDWLTDIYNIKKDPSINNFDLDYYDYFRDMVKKGELKQKEKATYEADNENRVNFEIKNMLITNHKLCSGQISTYFPVLYSELLPNNISDIFLNKDKINQVIGEILKYDFSAFHRELFYQNPKTKVEKEIIMKAIPPEIILVPTFGSKALMWQELTGKARNTPGRFLLPIMTCEDLEAMLIKLIGAFRWELCRTMMGSAWNDISERSLTSEYMDYIQFYKKNKDLSENAKEKLKLQITKYNNKTKDIFVNDYETWLKYESHGNLRLNKIARSILTRYCPFNNEIRERLAKQPIFAEHIQSFNVFKSKKLMELEGQYKRKGYNLEIETDLAENLEFYRL